MRKMICLILFLLLSASAFAGNQDTVKAADIKNQVRDFLDDPNGEYWTNAIIYRFIDLACREVASLGFIEKIDSVAITANSRRYKLPNDFIYTDRVTVKHPDTGNRERTMLERAFRRDEPGKQVFGGDGIMDYPQYWSVVGSGDTSFLVVDPPPTSSPASSYIFFYYRAQDVDLTADTTTRTLIPYQAIPLVVLSTVRNCLIKNRENPTNQLVMPLVDAMYKTYYALLLTQRSDPDYIPHQTSP